MTIELELEIASDNTTLPHPSQLKEWVSRTLKDNTTNAIINIKIVDIEEITSINSKFRGKDKPTNVISFEYGKETDDESIPLLGDIILCAPIIEQEANEQDKELLAHWAHMVVHGMLHVLGYDHQNNTEATVMESLETEILQELGFPPPYEDTLKDE